MDRSQSQHVKDDGDKYKDKHKLTPHTLRLLKLITSSSSSSADDHTKHAISLLSGIASKSHPIILWDILARLYISLTKSEESDGGRSGSSTGTGGCITRREYIALAMEHVARYIPSSDRQHFLMDSTIRSATSECKIWLKVQDFLPISNENDENSENDESSEKWATLEQVLDKGRLLLSSSGTQYETTTLSSGGDYEIETSMLSSLDASAISSSSAQQQEEILKERIKLQRRILAQRLGFVGILSSSMIQNDVHNDINHDNDNDNNKGGGLNDLISDEDLVGDLIIKKEKRDKVVHSSKNEIDKVKSSQTQRVSARERNIQRLQKRKRVDPIMNPNKISKKKESETSTKGSKKRDVNSRKNDNDDDNNSDSDDDGEKSTIRNLLLLSLYHRPNSTSNRSSKTETHQNRQSSDSSLISHQGPQILLATDMIYNSFHPSWHVRHGSLLGLLALLKSWQSSSNAHKDKNCHNNNSNDVGQQQSSRKFGRWPQDILTRCLCIIALDRFGDYAGATIKTSNNENSNAKDNTSLNSINLENDIDDNEIFSFNGIIEGAAMSAPVREVAARVLSLLLFMAPCVEIQQPCYQILVKLTSYEQEWEVRHGAFLAFKYIAHLVKKEDNEVQVDQCQFMDKIWDGVTAHALKGLKDQNDDVRGASAQVLCCFVRDCTRTSEEVIKNNRIQASKIISICAEQIWLAMKEVCCTSSCTLDLLNLFSQMISTDCHRVLDSIGVFNLQSSRCTMDQLLNKMNDFLNFDDISVRLCSFYTISAIVQPIATTLTAIEKAHLNETNDRTMQLYCNLLVNVFNSFLHDTNAFMINEQNGDNKVTINDNVHSKIELFDSARIKAWVAVVNAVHQLLRDEDILIMRKTFLALLFRLAKIDSSQRMSYNRNFLDDSVDHNLKSKLSTQYRRLLISCNAFAELYSKVSLGPIIDVPLAVFILCLLKSPWPALCETGCILLKLISQKKKDKSEDPLSSEYQSSLITMLNQGPNCVFLDSFENSTIVREDKSVKEMCDRTLVAILETDVEETTVVVDIDWVRDRINQVINVWSNTFNAFGIDFVCDSINFPKMKKAKHHMRISASIAGTILSFGGLCLPSKLTNLIRALMTSIKNEEVSCRYQTTCQDLACIIRLLRQSCKEQHSAVASKILENICSLASCDPQYDELPEGMTSCGWGAARQVLKLLLKTIPQQEDLTKIGTLWRWIACLNSSDLGSIKERDMKKAIIIFSDLSFAFQSQSQSHKHVVSSLLPNLILLACTSTDPYIRQKSVIAITNTCYIEPNQAIPTILPFLFQYLNTDDDDARRLGACTVMNTLVETLGISMCPFVRCLLPISMSMMTDPVERCSKLAAATFAYLVKLAPLVSTEEDEANDLLTKKIVGKNEAWEDESFRKVVDHLIHGKPLPPCNLPNTLVKSLSKSNITLRNYQKEGISWLCFLRSLRLNGALCDDMGLGKTVQALVAVAMSHLEKSPNPEQKSRRHSLIVCPSSVVGHWINEIKRVDPDGEFFIPLRYIGSSRKKDCEGRFRECNLIVTSYPVLRSDIKVLQDISWMYCVLDEGHLIKNPKTATAKAARCLRSRHKIILSGSPVQNKVQELWAAFDWLMPNYLGSDADFAERFGRDIAKSHLPGASVSNMRRGMNKLKILHQQVLPFILRREKGDVLKQLPPKIITDVPCWLTEKQSLLYESLCSGEETRRALESLQAYIKMNENRQKYDKQQSIGKDVLRSLIRLRMICTHPLLLKASQEKSCLTIDDQTLARFDVSGKICVLNDLLRNAGIFREDITAADNDQSLIYVQSLDTVSEHTKHENHISNLEHNEDMLEDINCDEEDVQSNESKCLIFAQFTQSLDIVEQLLFKPLMPSLRYVRIDGSVDTGQRECIIDQFVNDDSVKCMLLTTKVGSLGLNLQAADTVIFLEPDYNPHVDLQAMDRAHRIGQEKTVNVYRLITSNTIEEKIMALQRTKLAISNAIINTDNSTMFSMGTDKLLDLFDTNDEYKEEGEEETFTIKI